MFQWFLMINGDKIEAFLSSDYIFIKAECILSARAYIKIEERKFWISYRGVFSGACFLPCCCC